MVTPYPGNSTAQRQCWLSPRRPAFLQRAPAGLPQAPGPPSIALVLSRSLLTRTRSQRSSHLRRCYYICTIQHDRFSFHGVLPLRTAFVRQPVQKKRPSQLAERGGRKIQRLLPAPIIVMAVRRSATEIKPNSRPIVIWPRSVVTSIVGRRIARSIIGLCLWRLIHIEINSRRDSIFALKQVPGSKHCRLCELIGVQRKRLNDVLRRAEVMKCSIRIPIYL